MTWRYRVSRWPGPASGAAAALRFWLRRYALQDLSATVVALAWCWVVARRTDSEALLGLGTAVVETAAFYAVAYVRTERAGQARVIELVSEYGLAEALDLALRPLLMTAALHALESRLLAILAGSLAADLLFYAVAARSVAGPLPPQPRERDPGEPGLARERAPAHDREHAAARRGDD